MRQPLSVTAAAVAALLAIASGAPSTKPNLLMILQDDLGHWNVGFNSQRSAMPSADVAAVSPNLMALAKEGVILDRHYVHWHCSPTRRTFLTGRTPLHHGEQLSDPQTADHIDLRWSTIGHKLKAQGYETHWYGKGHTGYKSYNHLPKQLGFDSFIGFLGGAEAFTGYNRWRDNSPMCALQTAAAAGAAPASASSSPSSTAPAPPACTITKGVYFVGDATQHLASASDAECCAACQKDESCTAWTRDSSEPATRNCLFKPQSTKSRPEAAASSGTTFPPGPAPPGCGTAGHAPRLPTDAEYSALLYGDAAAASVKAHDVSKPLFMYLPWQSTHQPYTYAPGWNLTTADGRHKCDGMVRGASNNGVGNGMAEPECILYGMVWKTDLAVGNIVKELKAKGMWANTLIAYSADNGGVTDSVNFPLRGEKHTNWEGGVRGASFISGGLVPANVRGTINSIVFSVSDWYATFAVLGGASPRDDPKVPPLPVDPANRLKDIYGNFSFPSVDGVNIWPMLTHPERFNVSSAHKYLWVSHEVLIAGDYKLLLAQPQAKATTFNPTFQNIKVSVPARLVSCCEPCR